MVQLQAHLRSTPRDSCGAISPAGGRVVQVTRARSRESIGTSVAMSIGEVARRAGVEPSAIRYYESLGLLPEPPRAGGKRRYDASVLDWLSLIALAREA